MLVLVSVLEWVPVVVCSELENIISQAGFIELFTKNIFTLIINYIYVHTFLLSNFCFHCIVKHYNIPVSC